VDIRHHIPKDSWNGGRRVHGEDFEDLFLMKKRYRITPAAATTRPMPTSAISKPPSGMSLSFSTSPDGSHGVSPFPQWLATLRRSPRVAGRMVVDVLR
jgi:hypothetical protein